MPKKFGAGEITPTMNVGQERKIEYGDKGQVFREIRERLSLALSQNSSFTTEEIDRVGSEHLVEGDGKVGTIVASSFKSLNNDPSYYKYPAQKVIGEIWLCTNGHAGFVATGGTYADGKIAQREISVWRSWKIVPSDVLRDKPASAFVDVVTSVVDKFNQDCHELVDKLNDNG